jgi:hypothetical protein
MDVTSEAAKTARIDWIPSNDNQPERARRRSVFPPDTVARISRPGRSVTTGARVRPQSWRLEFERREPPFIEPLMGWIGGSDSLPQTVLIFPTLDDAVRYAQRQGLAYFIEGHSVARTLTGQPSRFPYLSNAEHPVQALEKAPFGSARVGTGGL